MKLSILLFSIFILSQRLSAQEELLPHVLTTEEALSYNHYLESHSIQASRKITLPPPGPVRTMGEWEQIQALIITWAGHSTILREIVSHAVKECKVLIITTNESAVTTTLVNAGIPLDSVQFVNTPFNSIWVRDYGPWTVYKNDVDSLFIVDWIYNRPRAQDDATPVAIASHLDIPIYEATVDPDDLVHTGGNHLPDGMGTAFSSTLVLEENPDKSEATIDSIAKKYLGVTQYIKFPTLPFDGIHHLDMHMRVIDEETIIFGEYPEGIADGPQINANIDYLLSEFQTSFGNPYRIVRMPMPPEDGKYPHNGGDYRTYTNSIFINKTILVPIYEEKYDTVALRLYRENLPGYNVVGINCNAIIPSLGALHCITKLVGVDEPLWIAHPRLRDTDISDQEFPIVAVIKHRSGIEEANLFYKASADSSYSSVSMVLSDSLQNIWTSAIPAFDVGTEVHYYIQAKAKSGKEQVRPIVAPEGYFKFRIHGDEENFPPGVRITYPENGAIFSTAQDTVQINIDAFDTDGNVDKIILYVDGDSVTTMQTFPYTYTLDISSPGTPRMYAKAIDNDGAETISGLVDITIEESTSSEELSADEISIFPNPVLDILWIKAPFEIERISVTNLIGEQISLPMIHDGSVKGFDFSGVSVGTYFIHYRVKSDEVVKRIVKI